MPRVMLPLHDRLTGRSLWRETTRLRRLQWEPAQALEKRALERLRALVAHATATVPLYRERFGQAGLAAGDLRSLDDLDRAPVLTRADVRAHFPDALVSTSVRAGRRHRVTTAGSSGQPLTLYLDTGGADQWVATFLLFLEWAGTGLWHTQIAITAETYHQANLTRVGTLERLVRRLALGERTIALSGVELSATAFRELVERRLGSRPYFIRGYASYVARLAADLLLQGEPLGQRPRAVITHAETLTALNTATIRQAFGCPVSSQYSAWEVPQIAQTCPDNPSAFHVNSERVIVRIVRDDGTAAAPGERGRIRLTDVANRVMPLINYEIDDTAAWADSCACGRGFPAIESLDGRTAEVIQTVTGRAVSPTALQRLLLFRAEAGDYIWEYQAQQISPEEVVLRVVPTPRFDREAAVRMQVALSGLLGAGMTARVEAVDQLPREPSGKRRVILPLADVGG